MDRDMLRLYGTLTGAQRHRAAEGEGIALGSLSPASLAIVHKMVYASMWGHQIQYEPPRNADGSFQPPAEGENPWELYYNGLLSEPTESMPNGIPPRGTLKMTPDDNEVVFTGEVRRRNWTQPGQAMTAEDLGWQLFAASRKDLFPWMAEQESEYSWQPNLAEFRLGSRLKLDFKFQFTPSLSMQQTLQDNDIQPGPAMPFDKLPESFRKRVAARIEEMKKQYKDQQPQPFRPRYRPVVPP
jgi:hypothetical protein